MKRPFILLALLFSMFVITAAGLLTYSEMRGRQQVADVSPAALGGADQSGGNQGVTSTAVNAASVEENTPAPADVGAASPGGGPPAVPSQDAPPGTEQEGAGAPQGAGPASPPGEPAPNTAAEAGATVVAGVPPAQAEIPGGAGQAGAGVPQPGTNIAGRSGAAGSVAGQPAPGTAPDEGATVAGVPPGGPGITGDAGQAGAGTPQQGTEVPGAAGADPSAPAAAGAEPAAGLAGASAQGAPGPGAAIAGVPGPVPVEGATDPGGTNGPAGVARAEAEIAAEALDPAVLPEAHDALRPGAMPDAANAGPANGDGQSTPGETPAVPGVLGQGPEGGVSGAAPNAVADAEGVPPGGVELPAVAADDPAAGPIGGTQEGAATAQGGGAGQTPGVGRPDGPGQPAEGSGVAAEAAGPGGAGLPGQAADPFAPDAPAAGPEQDVAALPVPGDAGGVVDRGGTTRGDAGSTASGAGAAGTGSAPGQPPVPPGMTALTYPAQPPTIAAGEPAHGAEQGANGVGSAPEGEVAAAAEGAALGDLPGSAGQEAFELDRTAPGNGADAPGPGRGTGETVARADAEPGTAAQGGRVGPDGGPADPTVAAPGAPDQPVSNESAAGEAPLAPGQRRPEQGQPGGEQDIARAGPGSPVPDGTGGPVEGSAASLDPGLGGPDQVAPGSSEENVATASPGAGTPEPGQEASQGLPGAMGADATAEGGAGTPASQAAQAEIILEAVELPPEVQVAATELPQEAIGPAEVGVRPAGAPAVPGGTATGMNVALEAIGTEMPGAEEAPAAAVPTRTGQGAAADVPLGGAIAAEPAPLLALEAVQGDTPSLDEEDNPARLGGSANPAELPGAAGGAAPQTPAIKQDLAIRAAEVETERLYVAGEAEPGTRVRVFADEQFVGEAETGPEGNWLLEADRDIAVGEVVIRADAVEPQGEQTLAQAEIPFLRFADGIALEPVAAAAEPEEGAAALETDFPGVAYVIIRRGDNLWRISKRNYGRGLRYQAIFAANKQKIRNPDLIYPGQIFVVPTRDREWEREPPRQ